MRAVMKITGLGRSTIYRLMASHEFPNPVRLAPRAVAWRRVDIDSWSQTRPTVAH
ncbi:MAG: AlpA family phage regulatory protein [Burkholderiaceae bacterium]|nr:MAG: AlpA family phage regulatory protein [Burkholderiaceae bacterium]